MGSMLFIASQPLSRSDLTYAAFRVSFLDTRERLALAHQLDISLDRSFGFLTEVPFLRNVPAHVQLDLLSLTWQKVLSNQAFEANLLDESIVYAVCETAANMVRSEPSIVQKFLDQGPVSFSGRVNSSYVNKFQSLHLDFDSPGNFLLISQFQDIAPDEADPLKEQYGIELGSIECMFDALERWYISPKMLDRLDGLLTASEKAQLCSLYETGVCQPLT